MRHVPHRAVILPHHISWVTSSSLVISCAEYSCTAQRVFLAVADILSETGEVLRPERAEHAESTQHEQPEMVYKGEYALQTMISRSIVHSWC